MINIYKHSLYVHTTGGGAFRRVVFDSVFEPTLSAPGDVPTLSAPGDVPTLIYFLSAPV